MNLIFQAVDGLNPTDMMSSVPNITDLPPEIIASIGGLITLFKAVGIVFIVYFLFIIIRSILSIRRGKKIDKIYQKVDEIEKKLDKILGKHKKEDREKSSNKKHKKEKKK